MITPDKTKAPAPTATKEVEDEPVFLEKCASCGGQFPTYRKICSECEDEADVEGYRDGKKVRSLF
jgi:uncharacterized OB-fold protein